MTTETVEVHEHGKPRRAPVELVGRIVSGPFGLRYNLSAPLRVPCTLIARPSPDAGDLWRSGRAEVHEDGYVDLRSITAICEGDYIYRIGKPLTPSLEERIEAIERLLGMVADDLEVANDADLAGQREAAASIRSDAIPPIRESVPRTPSRGTMPL